MLEMVAVIVVMEGIIMDITDMDMDMEGWVVMVAKMVCREDFVCA